LISTFKRHYSLEGIKFQGDIPCLAYVLNLAIQDILKAIIKDKDAYNDLNNINVFYLENNNKEIEEEASSKSTNRTYYSC